HPLVHSFRTLLSLYASIHHRVLHSFPTRRSSDLILFSGFEIGNKIHTGGRTAQTKAKNSPVQWAYEYCLRTYEGKRVEGRPSWEDRKSTRLNSSHVSISYAVFCLKKKK